MLITFWLGSQAGNDEDESPEAKTVTIAETVAETIAETIAETVEVVDIGKSTLDPGC